MKKLKRGGGWPAIWYTWRIARKTGLWRLFRAMSKKNACKTCALGMGGQAGGMRNELGQWPEVCKKSFQTMVADMQKGLEPRFFDRFSIDQLRALSPRELEWAGRLTQPLYAGPGDTHYRTIRWDEALHKVAQQLQQTPADQVFFYASGRSSNEAGFLLQLLARIKGTNFVNNCSYYCHQSSSVGLTQALGTGTATVTLQDVERADLFFLIGGNPASNHPRLMRTLMNIRRRRGDIIVINPVREVGLVNFAVPSDLRSLLFGSPIASLYVQPHIGGDIALLTGVAKLLFEWDAIDHTFLETATEGFEDYRRQVESTEWDEIEHGSGVDRAVIEQVARMYQRAENVVFGWTMGITQHEHGVANVQTIVNLALLRGMVGRPNAGLLPIRGHSNVQGISSVGVTPKLKQAILDNLEKHLGIPLPASPGLDTMGCMKAAHAGTMRTALCLGGNLYGSNPDSRFAREALENLDLICYLSTTLNTGHAWGRGRETIILPVLARDEEPEPTTQESMFNFVRLSDGGPRRLEGPRSEVDVVAALGERIFGSTTPVDWKSLHSACAVRQMIARMVPGFEQLAMMDKTRQEFHIPGRHLTTSRFPTPSGKAIFHVHTIPPLRNGNGHLLLMTVRSEGQFNTVVYEEEDIYRGQLSRDVILMHAEDIERLGLKVNERVTVKSDVGEMHNILVRAFDIHPGNALMYFPEANVLVPTTTDAQSKTPAFKSVSITIERASAASAGGERGRQSLQLVGGNGT